MRNCKSFKQSASFSVLMYLAHRVRACYELPFLRNSLICFSNAKLLWTVTPGNISLELPSIEQFLIFMDFKLNDDRNKWHLEGFTLKLLQQNQSNIRFQYKEIISKKIKRFTKISEDCGAYLIFITSFLHFLNHY